MSNLFAAQVTYGVGSEPYGVAIADVNGDGKPDIVAANFGSSTVSVLLNSGSGTTLAFAAQVNYGVGSEPDILAIADVNADGKPDIVAPNVDSNTVSVLLNAGTGTTLAFATQVTYSVGSVPRVVAIADVNADGKPDIVAANNGATTVSVLLNSGTGTTLAFATQVTYSVGSEPVGVAIADVNADGKPDILAANSLSGTVSVLLNAGTGTILAFATQVTYGVGSHPDILAIADVNADGKPDIVVANYGSNTVSVLLNSGTGATLAFATQVPYSVGIGPQVVVISDVNADGKPDIVAANTGSNTVSVLLNQGTGTTLAFATQVTYSVGSAPVGVVISDVNADGKPDIVAANEGSSTVSVLLNIAPTPTRTASRTTTGTLSISHTLSSSLTVSPSLSASHTHTLSSSVTITPSSSLVLRTSSPSYTTTQEQTLQITMVACHDQSFATAVNYTVGSCPQGVAIADFNADDRPDIVTANQCSGTVSVMLNTGISFGPATSYAIEINPNGVAVADVNADGKPDIVAANNGAYTVSVLLNTGSSFAAATSYNVGGAPVWVAVADVNADGKPDIVTANWNSAGTVSVLLNTGNSFSAATNYNVNSFPAGVAVADVNADDKPDIVSANNGGGSGNTVSVLLNTGSSFAAATSYNVGSGPWWIAIADVNEDRKPDIIVPNKGSNTVSVLLNMGSSFATAISYSVGSAPNGVAIADVNADGKTDIVTANGVSNTVSVLLNTGSSFLSATNYTAGSNPYEVAIADVNADGKPDIVASNYGGNTVSVLLNICLTSTRTATRTSSPYNTLSSSLTVSTSHPTSHTHTPSPSQTPFAPTVSNTQSDTLTPSNYVSSTATQSYSVKSLSASSTASFTASKSASTTPISASDTSTISRTPSTLPTHTPRHSNTPTPSYTPTSTPTHTSSVQFSESVTRSTSKSFTSSHSSYSHTQSLSGTQSAEPTTTSSHTLSASITPSNGASNTPTHSIEATASQTPTPTFSETPTFSRTPTRSAIPTHTLSASRPVRAIVNLQDAADPSILRIPGPNDADATGYFVSGIGDTNKDGRGDFLISTSKTNTSATLDSRSCMGEAYVVFGQPSIPAFPIDVLSINTTTGFVIPNIQGFTISKTETGWQTWSQSIGAPAGDVNGDGVADFMISNFRTTTSYPQGNTGVAYVIFGKTSGFGASLDLASLNGADGFKISAGYLSTTETDGYANVLPGKRLAARAATFSERALGFAISGGDVNGDGYADIMIGDPWNGRLTGEVSVVYGQSSSFGPAYYVDSLGTSGFNIPGMAPLSNVGQAVSVGDINGDGKADIVFNNQKGFAYVVFGATNFSSIYNLAALNGANGFEIVGAPAGNKMALATGDVNGDGRSDIILTTPDQGQGVVYVVFGSASFAPQFNVTSLNGSNGFSIKGTATGRTLGVSIATGDVNGDHIADLIIAESDSACIRGSAYVIYGKADFSSDAAFNLNALDGTNGYKIINIPGCDYQGFTVSTADVDGNGRDDVLIGSGAQVSGGEAWVVLS
jgi:hypothetical protein